jgi:hypothetical protein
MGTNKGRMEDDRWQSKTYSLRFEGKRFYVCKFLFKVRKLASGRTIRHLFLWQKDIFAPGQPVYIARLCLSDFTTYLEKRVALKEAWRSRQYFTVHRSQFAGGRVQFFLNFKKGKPHLILKFAERTQIGKAEYFGRLSVADFRELSICARQYGSIPYRSGTHNI